MDNKAIAKQFIENLFVDNDKAYEVVSDDVRVNWPGYGMEEIQGKENLKKFFENDGPDKVLDIKIHHILGENDTVIGDGTIITERKGKKEISHFADVYTIIERKIVQLNSYMVFDQSNKKDQE